MRVVALLIGLGVASCWRGNDPPPATPQNVQPTPVKVNGPRGASCGEVAINVQHILEGSQDGALSKQAAVFGDVIQRRCVEDTWSLELRRCIAGANNLDETDSCEALATQAQMEALERDIDLTENAN